jgi:FAD/FMN-containing dehydrogenase
VTNSATIEPAILDLLKAATGPGGWIDDAAAIDPFVADQRGLFRGKTPLVLLPHSVEAVAKIVSICHDTATPMVPQGGNTGLVGGSVPFEGGGEVLLSLSKLDQIRSISAANNSMSVDAGCVLANIQAAAKDVDRLFPLSLAAEGSCQIGGNLSTNAGGTNVLRYGNTRDLVLGLEVVLPTGEIWDGMRTLRKDNTGYALKHLFIGAEGTLGIITGAALRLFPRPTDITTAFVAVPSVAAAIALLSEIQTATGEQTSAFELISRFALELVLDHIPNTRDPVQTPADWYVLVEVAAPDGGTGARTTVEKTIAHAIDHQRVVDATIAQSEGQAAAFWRIRETIPDAQTREGASIKHDVAVPIDAFAELVRRGTAAVLDEAPGARPCIFGHLGDGNAHFNITQPAEMEPADFLARWGDVNRRVHDIAHALGGSISAEHGLGRLKRDEVLRYKSDVEMDLMRSVKRALDPKNIMNPGKVVLP